MCVKGGTMKTVKAYVSIISFVVLLSLAAQAEVKAVLKTEKVSVQNGKEVMSSAEKAAPGDTLQLTVTYKNTDKEAASKVIANLPIDLREEYVAGSASPAGALASTDGANFFPVPLKRMVKNSEGKTVEQEIPGSEYRALRWSLGDLAGGASRTVTARVKIRTAPAAR